RRRLVADIAAEREDDGDAAIAGHAAWLSQRRGRPLLREAGKSLPPELDPTGFTHRRSSQKPSSPRAPAPHSPSRDGRPSGRPMVGAGRRGGSRGREKGARCFRANEIGMVRPPTLTRPHKRGRGPIGTVRDAARLRCVNTVAPLWGRAGEGGRAMRWRSGRSLIAGLNFIGRIRIERANRNGSARPPTLALPHHSPSKDGRSAERPLGGGDAP